MKKLSILTLALLCGLLAAGQQTLPKMGEVDKSDLQMTTCDFDPEAAAYILIATGQSEFYVQGQEPTVQTVYRYRIKILKDNGIRFGDVRYAYISKDGNQFIDHIQGETYNLDDSGQIVTTPLDRKNVFSKDVGKGITEIVFGMPEVRKGSIIDYTFTRTSRLSISIDPWNFQSDIPERLSRYSILAPSYVDFSYVVHKTLPVDIANDPGSGATVFTMQNIPGLHDEPYISAVQDYLQHVEFQVATIQFPGGARRDFRQTWKMLNDEEMDADNFGDQLHKKLPPNPDLDARLTGLTDSVARMKAVFNFVRSYMDWDGKDTRFSPDGIKTAWERKKAASGDINLILINLLREKGLPAYPLLVSTRRHGLVHPTSPMLAQFNEVFAYMILGGKPYVLNAADEYTPPELIPHDVQYAQGFIVDKRRFGWVDLGGSEQPFQVTVMLNAHITAKGVLKGNASVYNYDYSKIPRKRRLENGLDRFKQSYFAKAYPNLRVDTLSVSGQDNDSLPLDEEVGFSARLNKTGNYLFFSPNIFLGLESNPFVEDQRFSDVDFGYQQLYSITGTVELPEGYKLEDLPKNIRMITPDTGIVLERLMQLDDDKLSYRISIHVKRPIYSVDEYPNLKEFYKKMFATLNEPVVLEPKSE